LSQAIAAELPRLRRFARALTGSQESGDAYVVATLQALVADASLVPTAAEAKSSLYRLLLTVWNSVDVNRQPSLPSDNPAVAASDRRLQAVTPMAREAFLLTAERTHPPKKQALPEHVAPLASAKPDGRTGQWQTSPPNALTMASRLKL
jgi:DNA-directed RNA polymerase specialized sigma24 family protein